MVIRGGPGGTVDGARIICEPRFAEPAKNCGRVRCLCRARIDHLWRECRIPRNTAQDERNIRLHGDAALGCGQQGCAIETLKNWMRLLDAGVTVSLRSDDFPGDVCAKDIGQLKVRTWFAPFVVMRGFKRIGKR